MFKFLRPVSFSNFFKASATAGFVAVLISIAPVNIDKVGATSVVFNKHGFHNRHHFRGHRFHHRRHFRRHHFHRRHFHGHRSSFHFGFHGPRYYGPSTYVGRYYGGAYPVPVVRPVIVPQPVYCPIPVPVAVPTYSGVPGAVGPLYNVYQGGGC